MGGARGQNLVHFIHEYVLSVLNEYTGQKTLIPGPRIIQTSL